MHLHENQTRINVQVARTGAHENFKVQHKCTIIYRVMEESRISLMWAILFKLKMPA
jgi:hypothetical protein